jgi:hypothetical protein
VAVKTVDEKIAELGEVKTYDSGDFEEFIPIGFDVKAKEPVYLDFSRPRRIIACLPTGKGKSTTWVHRILDFLTLELGCLSIFIHDKHAELSKLTEPNPEYNEMLKNEMKWAGVDTVSEFRPFDETPMGWSEDDFKLITPSFCARKGLEQFSFKITDLPKEDWKTLLGIGSSHRLRWKAFKYLYEYLTYHREKGKEVNYTKRFHKTMLNDPTLLGLNEEDKRDIEKLAGTLEQELDDLYEEWIEPGVFEGPHPVTLDQLTEGGTKNLIIDWSKYKQKLSSKSERDKDTILVHIVRHLMEWAQGNYEKGYIVPTYVFGDEYQSLLTGHRAEGTYQLPHSLKAAITGSIEGRKAGLGLYFAFQGEMGKAPAILIENTDLFIVHGQSVDPKFLTTLKRWYPQKFRDKCDFEKFANVGEYECWVIDKWDRENPIKLVIAYPSLSRHYKAKGKKTRKMTR